MREKADLTKVSISKDVKKVVSIISAAEERFEYEIIDQLVRDNYPEFFE
jgi:hypothetical protein